MLKIFYVLVVRATHGNTSVTDGNMFTNNIVTSSKDKGDC